LRGLRGFAGLFRAVGTTQSEALFLISWLSFGKIAQGCLGENTRKTPHNPAIKPSPPATSQPPDVMGRVKTWHGGTVSSIRPHIDAVARFDRPLLIAIASAAFASVHQCSPQTVPPLHR
jgi:hypothetical protein